MSQRIRSRVRRTASASIACLFAASLGALLACGQETAAAPAESAEAEPVDPTERAPKPTDPDLAPRLREMVTSEGQIKRFVFFWKLNPTGVWSNTFMGIRTIQNPLDAWVTQEIFYEVKPDFVVEAGTLYGGSALLWATYLEQMSPEARVITIDIEDHVTDAKEQPLWKRKVDFLVGSSTDPAIVAEVRRRVGDGKVLVILDSDHSEAHVLREIESYAPLVSVGSYLIVQDTCAYGQPPEKEYPGGCRAIERFLAGSDALEMDRSRERFVLTNNAYGFLKRVR